MAELEASGTFEVTLTPAGGAETPAARMTLAKAFHGPLEATGAGEMLAVQTDTPGSAGYVAMERVSGTLGGRKGSFMLQHSGTMDRGAPSLSVTVVPDSATDELTGLTGAMAIDIRDGQHFYTFRYRLPK